jgi:hypothetical protein
MLKRRELIVLARWRSHVAARVACAAADDSGDRIPKVARPPATLVAKRKQRLHGVAGLSDERSDIAGFPYFRAIVSEEDCHA